MGGENNRGLENVLKNNNWGGVEEMNGKYWEVGKYNTWIFQRTTYED